MSTVKITVTEDRVVFWYRIHPKQIPCTSGTNNIGVVRNAAYPADAVFAWALVTEDSTISMAVGSNKDWTFQTVTIERNGKTLQTGNGSVAITQACSYEDYNPVVGLAGPPIQASAKMGNGSGNKGRPQKPKYQKSVC
ncbi:hypothetical protein LTR28_003415 [Elasticomyces elasticus]|nr:hypothetical protein LTR28_003415 [Elasticomyces elasticus]